MNDETLKNTIERIFDESQAFHAELEGESDRATAILAVARFEDRLREAIAKRFVELNGGVGKSDFLWIWPTFNSCG